MRIPFLQKLLVFPAATILFTFSLWTAAQESQDILKVPPKPFIRVTSKDSLIHLGSLDSFDITDEGVKAATLVYDYLTTTNAESARQAIAIYNQIIPSENFGGEYTALEWLCKFFLLSPEQQHQRLSDPVTYEWYDYLSKSSFAQLKEYLKMKYHLKEWEHRKTPKTEPGYRFLEDFVLFNNPDRERWEKTSEMLKFLPLHPGDKVADIGSGPGYFTFKFAQIVGLSGRVYAMEINRRHTDFVKSLAEKYHITNVFALDSVAAKFSTGDKVDLAYLCSLYHNVYAVLTEEQRDSFIASIKAVLKPGGTLVIVDNSLVQDAALPYHGPYIAKELIVNQMWYHGFKLVAFHQIIPQRYMLVFKLQDGPEPAPTVLAKHLPDDCVPLNSTFSVLRAPSSQSSPGFTIGGRQAARLFLAAIEKKDPASLRAALAAYSALIPKERFGDEYTADQWICRYLLATPKHQKQMLANWRAREYFNYVSANDFKLLKDYLPVRYYFSAIIDDEDVRRADPQKKVEKVDIERLEMPADSPFTQDQINQWGEYITFNNPARADWEKTAKMLAFLKLKPGDHVADVGSGSGYYTFQLSDLVGSNGVVYAVDTMQDALDRVIEVCTRHEIRNVRPVLGSDNDSRLPANSADLIYICSMYHAVYMTDMEYVKDGFIDSLKKSLRKGGRLVIADNAIMRDADNRYFGPGIAPEMIIAQLKCYGFRLAGRAQFIPQRYILAFELAPPGAKPE